jgi:hypothetical protein
MIFWSQGLELHWMHIVIAFVIAMPGIWVVIEVEVAKANNVSTSLLRLGWLSIGIAFGYIGVVILIKAIEKYLFHPGLVAAFLLIISFFS